MRGRAGAEGTTMQELRFVAVSEDGRYAVLAVPGRSARFTLPIDERLRAVALGQSSRLAQYEIEVESPLRPKEIQARIRAGETVEEIADAAGIAVERVRWFEAPILAERAYAADQAQLASVRRQGDATPGPRLGEIVTERLKAFGADPEDAQWDAKKLGDGSWQVQLTFISGGRLHTAEWIFDPRRRHVLPADDNAARMSLPGTEPPQPAVPAPGEATVTHLAPRLSSASAQGPGLGQPGAPASGFGQHGNGTSGFGPGSGTMGSGTMGSNGTMGSGGRARHERPGSGRPSVPQPQVAEHHPAEPERAEPQRAEPQRAEPPACRTGGSRAPQRRGSGRRGIFCAERSRRQSGHGSRPGTEDRARTPAGTNLSSRRRTPARTHGSAGAGFPGGAGISAHTGRSDGGGSPDRAGSSGSGLGSVLECRGLPHCGGSGRCHRPCGSGRFDAVSRRGGSGSRRGSGGTRGRAGGAPGPQGSARQAVLGAVLGRDHVR